MTEENTRCQHKITFGSYILSDYYEYCVCKKCKKKFEVKKKKFDWLKLLIQLMFVGSILATRIDDKEPKSTICSPGCANNSSPNNSDNCNLQEIPHILPEYLSERT